MVRGSAAAEIRDRRLQINNGYIMLILSFSSWLPLYPQFPSPPLHNGGPLVAEFAQSWPGVNSVVLSGC